jgi:PilZ domain
MGFSKPESTHSSPGPVTASGRPEVRCAVRFPLTLPVVLSTGESEVEGETRNISASGVLFSLEKELPVGLDVRFSMRMPHETLGSPQDVVVHCKGRVVRCSSSHNEHLAAATIDEYRFAEH